MLRTMRKLGILVATCIVLWSAATSAKSEDELDMIFFDVCAKCDTILPRESGVDQDDWRAAEKALQEALDSAARRPLERGSFITKGRRIDSVSLSDRTSLRVIAGREPDGRFRVWKYDNLPAPPADEKKPVPAEGEKTAPRWHSHNSVDRFDGARVVAVGAFHDGGQDAALWVRCRSNKTELIVTWPRSLGRGRQVAQWRLDDRPPLSETWQTSDDGRALFAAQSIPLVKQMFKAQEFAIRANPGGAGQQSLFFKIAGLEEAIAPVRQACGW